MMAPRSRVPLTLALSPQAGRGDLPRLWLEERRLRRSPRLLGEGGGSRMRGGWGWRRSGQVLLALFLLLAPLPAFAVNPDEILKDPALEQRARQISTQLRCMVCQNQSIDDSNAELARDLRVLVRERLTDGDTDGQVIDYVVSRYGEFVLLNPRVSARTIILWALPIGALVIGIVALFVFIRTRPNTRSIAALTDAEKKRIDELLKR